MPPFWGLGACGAGDADPAGADALRSREPDPWLARDGRSRCRLAPSRLAERAHEIVAYEPADRPEFASLVETLLAMRADVIERIAGLDAELRARARTTPVCRRFMTVPGVGPITALAVWAGIDDAARFARSRDVGAWFGLTP